MMYYSNINEIPDWAQAIVCRLIEAGAVKCDNGTIEPLSEDMLNILMIIDRLNLI